MFEKAKGLTDGTKLNEGDLILFAISRNEIEMAATYRLEIQISELKKAGKNAKNSVVFHFEGYDNDPREVYDIPEIREYLRLALKNIPELFYFIGINNYTFAILLNAIFRKQEEVQAADEAVLQYAESIGDRGRVITVSYYAAHHQDLIKEYEN